MRVKNTCFLRSLLLGLLWWAAPTPAKSQYTISGRLTTPAGDAMPGVVIDISGSITDFVLTDSLGYYTAALPAGGAYTLAPQCNRYPLNGVTTFDLVLIMKHILGGDPFDSPYKRIAADVNNNGFITPLDSLLAREVILGLATNFPNNSSWRFVLKDYEFPDPENPFEPPYPETYTVPNLDGHVTNVDFYGIKVGDVNNTAVLAQLTDSTHLSWIDGFVRIDENVNCAADSTETAVPGWTVQANNVYGTFYARTDPGGYFSIGVPPGDHSVNLLPPNDYWAPCPDTISGIVTTLLNHTTAPLPVQVETECPYMTVDLSASFLRRCFENTYYVWYCNLGTVPGEDARIEITFDSFLQVQSSTLPWSAVNGNTYTFELGDVPSNECDGFEVQVLVDCDAPLGATHCAEARIFPDSICGTSNAQWSGADLEVRGHCQGDNVIFSIQNKGAAMLEPVEYVVIEDIMIQMTSSTLQLGENQTYDLPPLPANGSTWRVEVDQPEHHPWSNLAAAWVEGCLSGSGSASLGYVTQFPYGDGSPTVDVDCQENISSFDPNDKQGFPGGVEDEHFIPKNQDITYKIRFQNTGTDTAFNIVIRDTLSSLLDAATLRPGSSSHPYTYQLVGPGVAQFLFQNILLPDSNVNEPLSHGFVQFTINQRANLPNNSRIENDAAIYFDFNAPVITNRTWHTVGEKYLDLRPVVFQPGLSLSVFPNPATDKVTFAIQGSLQPLSGRLLLFDAQGRPVREQVFPSNLFDIRTAGLPAGLYFYRIESDRRVLAGGKLIVQE